jgi:hypothetical protein
LSNTVVVPKANNPKGAGFAVRSLMAIVVGSIN